MNRIQRITAAAAIGAAVFAPATATVASASDPGQPPQTSSVSRTKAAIEHNERLQMLQTSEGDGQSASSKGSDSTGFPWETVGLAALAGAALTAGGVAVVRRFNHEPSQA
jgi:hypothetical protein